MRARASLPGARRTSGLHTRGMQAWRGRANARGCATVRWSDRGAPSRERHALAMQRLHFVHDEARFLVVVRGGEDAQLLALAFGGPEILAQARLVLRDDCICRVEDISLRAIVLFQLDDLADAVVAD